MIGPVLHHEMMLGSRRSRAYVFRWIYAGWLILVLFVSYLSYRLDMATSASPIFGTGIPDTDATGRYGAWFVSFFTVQQLILLLLITPVFTAGAVTDEKTRGTLQYLMTTDLQPWHLIVGKLLGRVLQVVILMVTGLPVLCFLGVFGGLDPVPLFMLGIVTILPIFAIGAASLLASVWSKHTRDAVLGLYAVGGVILAGLWVLDWFAGTSTIDVLNPLWVISPLWGQSTSTSALRETVGRLGWASLAWGGTGLACLGLAIWRLRPAYIRQLESGGFTDRSRRRSVTIGIEFGLLAAVICGGVATLWSFRGSNPLLLGAIAVGFGVLATIMAGGLVWEIVFGREGDEGGWWVARRKPLGNEPIPWKERHVDGIAPISTLRRVPTWLALLIIFATTVTTSLYFLSLYYRSVPLDRAWELLTSLRFVELMDLLSTSNTAAVVPGTVGPPPGPETEFFWQGIVAMLVFSLMVGIRCSGTISGEREKQSWEALLLTPLTSKQLIRGKVWGIMGATYIYLFAYAIPALVLSFFGGFLSFFWTATWLGVTWLAMYYVGAAGVWCSVRAKSSWRSLLTTLGLGYVGGIVIYAVMTPVIAILALLILMILAIIDNYLKTALFMTVASGFATYYMAFKIGTCLGLAAVFFGLAVFFLRDAQKWVADRERTRHWHDEPVYRPRRRPAKVRYYR